MSQENRRTGVADADDTSTARPPNTRVGVGISIGAGLGLVIGMLFGDMLLVMTYGVGIGTLVGAVFETLRRRHR